MSDTEREGFLARWSRRKRAAEPEPETAAPPQAEAPGPDAAETDVPVGRAEAPACPIPNLPEIDLDSLPNIEELTAESDFSLFLRPGIPQGLRNAALRRMWSLDPAIRDYIGPVDYQWDFNTPGGLPFGFSNELVGDIGKMLAQAIGQLPEGKEAGEEEAPAGEPADSPEQPGAALEDLPMVEAPPADPPIADPVRLAAVAEVPIPPEPAPETPPMPRRRHGGALPG